MLPQQANIQPRVPEEVCLVVLLLSTLGMLKSLQPTQRLNNVTSSMSRCCDRWLPSTDLTIQTLKPDGSDFVRFVSRRCDSYQGQSAGLASLACPGNNMLQRHFQAQVPNSPTPSRTPSSFFIGILHRNVKRLPSPC